MVRMGHGKDRKRRKTGDRSRSTTAGGGKAVRKKLKKLRTVKRAGKPKAY